VHMGHIQVVMGGGRGTAELGVAAVDPDARHLLRAATLHHRVGGTGLCEGMPVEEGPP
jgi:hypothetical protein